MGSANIWRHDTSYYSGSCQADFSEIGVDSLVIRDINLTLTVDYGWLDARMVFYIEHDLPDGSGIDFRINDELAEPEYGYDEYVSALMGNGLTGSRVIHRSSIDVFDHLGEIVDITVRIASVGGIGSVRFMEVFIEGSNGISETRINIPIDLDIKISPNPANSAFSIHAPTGNPVSIYNVRGELVHCQPRGGSFIWQPESSLPSGIYIVTSGNTSRPAVLIR